MELSVLNIEGKDTGKKVNLNDEIFGIEPNNHAIYLDVKQYLANNRQGTSQTKQRGEVIASTKKVKRQKGTGTARMGSVKSPTRVGGGRAFGPQPRDYRFKLNKKVKTLARVSAMIHKIKSDNFIVLENFDYESPKTKNIISLKKNLKIDDKKTLLVLLNQNNNIYLSSRNLKDFNVVNASALSTYDIMKSQKIIVVEGSLEFIEQNFCKS